MTGFPQTPGTLTHLLIGCPALSDVRLKMISLWRDYILDKPTLFPLVNHHTVYSDQSGEELHMLFLLDPSSCPTVILSAQNHGQGILSDLMYLTRTPFKTKKPLETLKCYPNIWVNFPRMGFLALKRLKSGRALELLQTTKLTYQTSFWHL